MAAEDVLRRLNVERIGWLAPRSTRFPSGMHPPQGRESALPRLGDTAVTRSKTDGGSVAGPHPYPWMVRDLQSVISASRRRPAQILSRPACCRQVPASGAVGRGL